VRALLHSKVVTAVALTPDGKYIITGDASGTLRVWSMGPPWDLVTIMPSPQPGPWSPAYTPHSLVVSPGGGYLVSGHRGGKVLVWDLRRHMPEGY